MSYDKQTTTTTTTRGGGRQLQDYQDQCSRVDHHIHTYYTMVTFSDGASGNNTHKAVIKDYKELDCINVLMDHLKANNINLQ
eukprot:15325502-Ditylum_brightwellii.AAC.3